MLLNSGRKIDIYHSEKTASTNDDAKACSHLSEGSLFVSDLQTAGRGRKGRSFSSKEGGLYASLLLKPAFTADKSILITVAAAVAAALAVDKLTGKSSQIKWVNDIFYEGKKVCGILTEGAFDKSGKYFDYAVLGIGVNLIKPKDGFPKDIKNIATALFESGDKKELKEQFLYCFLNTFFEFYENIEKKEFLKLYREKSLLTGRTVSYIKNGREYSAKVKGITDNAELTVITDKEEINLSSGEVKIVI